MKAVFVGKVGESKLYYVLDAETPLSDGVLVDEQENPKIVSFWDTVRFAVDLKKNTQSSFHQYLWSSPSNEESEKWYRIFIKKSQKIEDRMLNGVQVRSDIMKAKPKNKSLMRRADQFKTSLLTGTMYFATKTGNYNE